MGGEAYAPTYPLAPPTSPPNDERRHVEVPALDDPRISITISVPVKGRKPIELTLPRFDFIADNQYDEMIAASEQAARDNPNTPARKVNKLVNLAMLKPFLTAKDLAVCETLPPGQIDAIMLIWVERSSISLGELLASAQSSTANTEAASNTTLTPAGGRGATSDAA